MQKIRKAVFPAAGLGTRFLPATKAVAKELLPVAGKPAIQHVVEEARAAGIEHCVFVIGRNKEGIADLFDISVELDEALAARHQMGVDLRGAVPPAGTTSYTRQSAPLGLGHAVWCARHLIGTEPFAVLLPDVIMRATPGGLAQIMQTYDAVGGNVISIEECAPRDAHRYGVVGIGEPISEEAFRVTALVEKPPPESAPSTSRINGRYILQPEIFDVLEHQEPGAGGEIQLTDAIAALAGTQPVYGHRVRGRSFDCGSPEGFLAANVAFAMDDPKLAAIVKRETARFSE